MTKTTATCRIGKPGVYSMQLLSNVHIRTADTLAQLNDIHKINFNGQDIHDVLKLQELQSKLRSLNPLIADPDFASEFVLVLKNGAGYTPDHYGVYIETTSEEMLAQLKLFF